MKNIRAMVKEFPSLIQKKENIFLVIFFFFIFGMLFTNTFHESYPDEFDNILGGWDMRHGILIYRDFFTHHGPVAYFLSAAITLISQNSFVAFRVVFSILIFLFILFSYIYLRKRFGGEKAVFYLPFIFVIALAGNYYWLHMLLADSLSAYFLSPVLAILLLTTFYRTALIRRDIIIISILTSLTVLCSLTFLYCSFLIYGYTAYLYLKSNKYKLLSREGGEAVVIFVAPYFLFLLYLLATFSLKDYLYDGFTFNQQYYIYNYPRPEGSTNINPIRFSIVIANNFYNSYFTLLEQVKDLNLGFPLNITLALGTISAVFYFLWRRYYVFSAFLMGFIMYANARSEPLTSKETDYQSAVYIMIAFVVIPFILIRLYRELNEHQKLGEKVLMGAIFLLLVVYSVFSTMFLFQKFFNRGFEKYMGRAPLIYDNPEIAPIMNKIVKADETTWIGPFEFKELFYTNAKPASKYQIFIPGMGLAEEVHQPFIDQFEKNKPPVIYFQKNFNILGREPQTYGQFFLDYLSDHYVLLMDYENDGVQYKSLLPVTEKLDLAGRLYMRKERASEIIQRLLDNHFIEETTQ